MNERALVTDGDDPLRHARDAPKGRAEMSFIVATTNRTSGAVLCGLLTHAGYAARWMARRDVQAALAKGSIETCDVLLIEATTSADVAAAAAARTPEGPALIAIASSTRPELQAACEAAGFDGCLASPVDPASLCDTVDAALARIKRVARTADQEQGALSSSESSSPVDMRALHDLANLGGEDFVDEIVSQFMEDAGSLLRTLRDAARARDARTFRDQAHALRSCAANVGASGVYSKCLALRDIGASELAEYGDSHVQQIESEVSQACDILKAYLARPDRIDREQRS